MAKEGILLMSASMGTQRGIFFKNNIFQIYIRAEKFL